MEDSEVGDMWATFREEKEYIATRLLNKLADAIRSVKADVDD